jgi:lipoprotein-anchoring transpeptidase ErfK/SrfK
VFRHRGWWGLVFGLALACRDRAPSPPASVHRDSSAAPTAPLPPPPPPPPPAPAFRTYALAGASDLKTLTDSVGPEALTTILKLNRIDLAHARAGDTLVVPTTVGPEMGFSPFPETVPLLDSVPRLIAVSQRVQAFGAYEFGRLVRWGPTSTGKSKTPTPNALYFTNWKRKQTVSTDNDEWLLKWYFNFENSRGISFHEYELPGYPASHACVRLMAEDAEWIYYWARQWRLSKDGRTVEGYGTPVHVFGKYDTKGTRPWKRLIEDPGAASIPAAELDSVLTPHLPLIRGRIRPDSG